jgi:hypothetical protein
MKCLLGSMNRRDLLTLSFLEKKAEVPEIKRCGLDDLALIYSAHYGLPGSLQFMESENLVMALYQGETGKRVSALDAVIPIAYRGSVSLDEIKEMGFGRKRLKKLRAKIGKTPAYSAFAESKKAYDIALKEYQACLMKLQKEPVPLEDRYSGLLEKRITASDETLYNMMMIAGTMQQDGKLYYVSDKTTVDRLCESAGRLRAAHIDAYDKKTALLPAWEKLQLKAYKEKVKKEEQSNQDSNREVELEYNKKR